MVSVLITSWQIDGKKLGTVADFIFLGSKITADSDGSQEIKRYLLLGRKAMTNLDMSRHHKPRHHFAKKSSSGEGNGTPLQYSCLENPMGGGAGRLQSMGSLESDMTEQLHFHFPLSSIGEGNGNPLQYSCLENPRDGEAWWAAVYGVAQSRT